MDNNQKIERLDTPHGRVYYFMENGEPFFMPSVTTILSSLKNEYLEKLSAELGDVKLAEIAQRAANRGTCLHSFLENYFIYMAKHEDSGKALEYTQKKTIKILKESGMDDKSISKGRDLFYTALFSDYFNNVKRPLFTEKFTWSKKHRFAGTIDFGYLNTESKFVITDFKSASSERNEETIDKYKLQVAGGYALSIEELHGHLADVIEIWVVMPDKMEVISVQRDDVEIYKNRFKNICMEYHSKWDIEPIIKFWNSKNYVGESNGR